MYQLLIWSKLNFLKINISHLINIQNAETFTTLCNLHKHTHPCLSKGRSTSTSWTGWAEKVLLRSRLRSRDLGWLDVISRSSVREGLTTPEIYYINKNKWTRRNITFLIKYKSSSKGSSLSNTIWITAVNLIKVNSLEIGGCFLPSFSDCLYNLTIVIFVFLL